MSLCAKARQLQNYLRHIHTFVKYINQPLKTYVNRTTTTFDYVHKKSYRSSEVAVISAIYFLYCETVFRFLWGCEFRSWFLENFTCKYSFSNIKGNYKSLLKSSTTGIQSLIKIFGRLKSSFNFEGKLSFF